ncbi:alanine racemase [bacterium]|nr:alanine racemase [bacterium]
MKQISLQKIALAINGELKSDNDILISNICVDTRKLVPGAIFFALKGENRDGHKFVEEAFSNGAIAAVVEKKYLNNTDDFRKNPLIFVENTLEALQALAIYYRDHLQIDVIGITGSNGKTLLKDCLAGILGFEKKVHSSPGSFNSQVGVPLSIFGIEDDHEIAIIEAGISKPGEMERLARIIKPTYGILTNIGEAHLANFGSREKISHEKLKLFYSIPQKGWLILPDDPIFDNFIRERNNSRIRKIQGMFPKIRSWKYDKNGSISLAIETAEGAVKDVQVNTNAPIHISIFQYAICAANLLGINKDNIFSAIEEFYPQTMRMEIWRAASGTTIINDSYCADPYSVDNALKTLNFLTPDKKKIFVFGGMREMGKFTSEKHYLIGRRAAESGIEDLILVGQSEDLKETEKGFKETNPSGNVLIFQNKEQAADYLKPKLKSTDTVLVKGPTKDRLDLLARSFLESIAPNRLYINLNAISENLSTLRGKLSPSVKVMAMVKALAYGTDTIYISRHLADQGIDYFGVSFPDEGASLRKAGINIPILVLSTPFQEAEKILRYNLDAVIFTSGLPVVLDEEASKWGKKVKIHLKVDTGMSRLGISFEEVEKVVEDILKRDNLVLEGIMTHLSSSDKSAEDDFTDRQLALFDKAIEISEGMGARFKYIHAASTSAIVRKPEAHYNMVRIGLGLYGVYPSESLRGEIFLTPALALSSRLCEIRYLKKGDSISYGRSFRVDSDNFKIGILPIGYHDGLPRNLSNKGHVLVNGMKAPIVGKICMDYTMISLQGIDNAQVGDDVLIFGNLEGFSLPLENVADYADTIPYEILVRTGERVQRIFLQES